MKNKDYEVLLNENYIEEVYRLILIDYIKLFSNIIGESIEKYDNDNIENVFTYLYWKVFRYSDSFYKELRTLKELISNFGYEEKNDFDILNNIEELYYDIKNKCTTIKELSISEYLKELCDNDDLEFAIELIQNIYYYPMFIKMLKEKNIEYIKYDTFINILNILKNNCREYRSILQTINGYYPYDVTLKERLNDLLDLTEAFES
ncbi:MAG: hypothetical protein ACI4ON_01035 [Clostridia bacterium]